jgi:hypothetical protein
MKITKSQLRTIIAEEIQALEAEESLPNFTQRELITLEENGICLPKELQEQGFLAGAAAGLGKMAIPVVKKMVKTYMIDKLSSSEGREELADHVMGLVELIEKLCGLADRIDAVIAGEAEKRDYVMPPLLKDILGTFCRTPLKVYTTPLNLLASTLRSLDDVMSGFIVDSFGEESEQPAIDVGPEEI